MLDSQPELIFCITSAGKVTYISDRMMNFVKINYGPEDNGDEDPTHVSQLLTSESSLELTDSINKLRECAPASTDDLSLLFSAKVSSLFPLHILIIITEAYCVFLFLFISSQQVSFYDTFGNKLFGLLRCSKVHRRSALQDLQFSESLMENKPTASIAPSSSQQPPAKKAKTNGSSKSSSLSSHSSSSNSNGLGMSTVDGETSNGMINNNPGGANMNTSNQAGWNLSNFNMLADCALSEEGVPSSLTGSSSADKSEKDKKSMESSSGTGESGSNDGQDISRSESSNSNNGMLYDTEDEFVCVIRTNNQHFAPYRKDVKDVLMFSSAALLSTTSMEAHNSHNISNNTISSNNNIPGGGSSPRSSNSSNNSSDQTGTSSKANTTSASSESASDDNGSGNSDQSA